MTEYKLALSKLNSMNDSVIDSDIYSDATALQWAYDELKRVLRHHYGIKSYDKIRLVPHSVLLLVYSEDDPTNWHVVSNRGVAKFRKYLKENSFLRFKLMVDPQKQLENKVYKEYARVALFGNI